ncbi:hypothetical protein AAVH_22259 [Aphelenchoides avenae]|nr:hypothetical protein AAVH_22259 [Aphelenchus avenae]
MNRMYQVECQLMREYFTNVEDVRPYIKEEIDMTTVFEHFFFVWTAFEIAITTMRNRGYLSHKLFHMDESFMLLTYDKVEEFYKSAPSTPNAEIIAKHGVENYPVLFGLAQSIKRRELDDAEMAILLRLIFVRYEAALFSSAVTQQEYVNEVLRSLYEHCTTSSLDYAGELDKITSVLEEFHQAYLTFCEICIVIDLYAPNRDTTTNMSCLVSYRHRKRVDDTLQEMCS